MAVVDKNETAMLAVFGNPVEHSLSPIIHQHFAHQEGRKLSYEKILVAKSFESSALEFFSAGGLGCNITVPCKLDAYAFVSELTDRAQIAHAVNTIKLKYADDGTGFYVGDNTDGEGLFSDLVRLDCPLDGARILILGAGGATRGIVPTLLTKAKLKSLTIANRTVSKAQDILTTTTDFYRKKNISLDLHELKACSYEDLATAGGAFDVILNATSLSLNHELPAITDEVYSGARFVYDLFYTQDGSTVFTQKAKALGVAASYDGLGMLVGQAALSYKMWFGFTPDIAKTLEHMRSVLKQRAAAT